MLIHLNWFNWIVLNKTKKKDFKLNAQITLYVINTLHFKRHK